MGMTMAEKILARTAGRAGGRVRTARVDRVMAHEVFVLCALNVLKLGIDKLFDPERVIVILDHYSPARYGADGARSERPGYSVATQNQRAPRPSSRCRPATSASQIASRYSLRVIGRFRSGRSPALKHGRY